MKEQTLGSDPPSHAISRTIGLLCPPAGSQLQVESGRIDLLGERDPIGSPFVQRAMRSRFVSRIYERLWRPLASRAVYGLFGPRPSREYRIALEMLEISPGDLVLDIGCGPGNFTRRFAQAAGSGLVVGLDASEPMLDVAVKRDVKANLAFVRGDACALPFGDAEFDAVGCVGALHLFEDPIKALDEMTRVLAPGGRLGLIAAWRRKDPPPRRFNGATMFERDALTNALAGRGFDDIEQSFAGWGQFVSARKPKG